MNKQLSKTELAILNNRSLFQYKVKPASLDVMRKSERLIKRSTNKKLGKKVTKGIWKSYPIYTLTLEERATCPRSCFHYEDCFGNNMHRAIRYRHGPELEAMCEDELVVLQAKHPNGFVVRLHILGDFYSVSYVAKWAGWLTKFPALHVYGYTANQPNAQDKLERDIGQAILSLRTNCPNRFAVRFSGNFTFDTWTANSYDDPVSVEMVKNKQAFLCPTQISKETGRYAKKDEETIVPDCGACGLCWTASKPVIFITH
tara:strand:- start:2349 stop:3122 length:774 start_codon:yes stop_codon:yes gene_type:complete